MTTDKNKQNKQCTRCKEILPYRDFYYTPSKAAYTAKCKSCTIEYNMERRTIKPRPKRVPQTEVHRKLLSTEGPENSIFHGRYVHGYAEFVLYRGPYGCVLDGELLYGTTSIDDLLYILHTRHMKLIRRLDSEIKEGELLSAMLQVRNACGVPIDVRFVQGLVSLDQYFLWMDKPRKLLISEAADQTSLSEEIVKFLVPEKSHCNRIISPPVNLKNPSTNSPQVIESTYEYAEE